MRKTKYNEVGWPDDEVSSGNRDDQCYAIYYSREIPVLGTKRKMYFNQYPTKGYNTTVKDSGTVKAPCGHIFYFVYITRWHSCD
jgi:hypothetical protein